MNIIYSKRSELCIAVEDVLHKLEHGGEIALQTSGTTGNPKNYFISTVEVLARKRGVGRSSEKWLLCYSPIRWAGISLITHCWFSHSTLVVPQTLDIDELIAAAITYNVSHISLTPSLFKKMILAKGLDVLAKFNLSQITFGGEWTSQNIIDQAKKIWPTCRITHTYALTEFGDVFSISNERAGIPKQKFERHSLTDDGELVIGGCLTGDLWKLSGDHYFYVGRREEIVNVGGNKVSPVEIESLLHEYDTIKAVRVYGLPNAVLGEVVAIDYVGEMTSETLFKILQSKLPKYAWPLCIRNVAEIEITSAGKTRRK